MREELAHLALGLDNRQGEGVHAARLSLRAEDKLNGCELFCGAHAFLLVGRTTKAHREPDLSAIRRSALLGAVSVIK